MISRLIILGFALLLLSCGGKEDDARTGVYSENARKPGLCSPRTIQTWQTMVAAKCRVVRNEHETEECLRGLRHFRRANPGVNCMISQKDSQWGEDADPTVLLPINDFVLRQMEEQYRTGQHQHGVGS